MKSPSHLIGKRHLIFYPIVISSLLLNSCNRTDECDRFANALMAHPLKFDSILSATKEINTKNYMLKNDSIERGHLAKICSRCHHYEMRHDFARDYKDSSDHNSMYFITASCRKSSSTFTFVFKRDNTGKWELLHLWGRDPYDVVVGP